MYHRVDLPGADRCGGGRFLSAGALLPPHRKRLVVWLAERSFPDIDPIQVMLNDGQTFRALFAIAGVAMMGIRIYHQKRATLARSQL